MGRQREIGLLEAAGSAGLWKEEASEDKETRTTGTELSKQLTLATYAAILSLAARSCCSVSASPASTSLMTSGFVSDLAGSFRRWDRVRKRAQRSTCAECIRVCVLCVRSRVCKKERGQRGRKKRAPSPHARATCLSSTHAVEGVDVSQVRASFHAASPPVGPKPLGRLAGQGRHLSVHGGGSSEV
jgi:hypothetical protein